MAPSHIPFWYQHLQLRATPLAGRSVRLSLYSILARLFVLLAGIIGRWPVPATPQLYQQHTAAKGSASKHLAPPLESRLIRSFSGFTFDPYDRGGYVANGFFTRGCGRWVQTISDISQRDGTTTTTLSG